MSRVLRLLLLLAGIVAVATTSALAQARDPATVERQRRAMLEAAERGDVSTINRVLAAGGSVNVRDDLNRTPLLIAVEHDRLDAFKVLLDEGADIDAQAHNQDTPWLLAGARGRLEMLKLMLPKKPNLALRNRYGGNALIPACHYGHVDTVKFLVAHARIDLDHVNALGWTCLLEAVLLGDGSARYQDIVRTVVQAGANPNIPDKQGKTALANARSRGQTQIVAILEAAKAR